MAQWCYLGRTVIRLQSGGSERHATICGVVRPQHVGGDAPRSARQCLGPRQIGGGTRQRATICPTMRLSMAYRRWCAEQRTMESVRYGSAVADTLLAGF